MATMSAPRCRGGQGRNSIGGRELTRRRHARDGDGDGRAADVVADPNSGELTCGEHGGEDDDEVCT